MKRRFALILLAAALCMAGAAKTSNEVIRDIRSNNKTFTVRLNWLTMGLMSGLTGEKWIPATGHISSGTIVTLTDGSESAKDSFLKSVGELDTNVYEPLTTVNDDEGETVQMYGRMKKGSIRELLIVVAGSDDCVLVRLKGRLTKDDVQKMLADND